MSIDDFISHHFLRELSGEVSENFHIYACSFFAVRRRKSRGTLFRMPKSDKNKTKAKLNLTVRDE